MESEKDEMGFSKAKLEPICKQLYAYQTGRIEREPLFEKQNAACCGMRNGETKPRKYFDMPSILAVESELLESDSQKYAHEGKMKSFKLIETGQMTYDKPLLIIYNPGSGRRVDKKDLIKNELGKNSL